ncbi:tetratricopeptide repeat-containing sulfotransferase family protein [Flavobacterium sp. W21_SRS_FM6]|uniref:tetratricopeptide repeat-containing sulfotransferase family protein n=1 Tax=Flavobacterium sp. W21_SRS_FM6 TaxID=3240268 RepID=UPI003F8DA3D8
MNTIKQLHRLAQEAINHRDYVKGHRYCVEIIQQNPQHGDSYFLLAMINVELGQINKAIQLIQKALEYSASIEYYAHLCKCYALQGNMSQALASISHVTIDQVSDPLTLDTLGVALSRVGAHQKALAFFEKAMSLNPNNAAFFYNYGVSSKFAGLFTQARQAFETAIRLKPDHYQAHFALSDLGKVSQDDNHIERLEKLLAISSEPDGVLHLGHALAKEYEALGQHQKAFAMLQKSKSTKLSSIDYQFSQDVELFAKSRLLIENTNNTIHGCDANAPIFVMGMPRSGTTLVERILSNHSHVDSCGELQDFGIAVKELTRTSSVKVLDVETLSASKHIDMRALGQRYMQKTAAIRGTAPRFVDKLPFNFFYIGLIKQALPNAKIILLQRNPMDTCIGNFRQLFTINSPYYAYAFDLLTIGRFYAEFYRLGQYWQTQHSNNVLFLNYEQLVQEPEQQIRQLLQFCELDWQEQCLHVETNQAPVSTASKVQVRDPINTSSIGRWRKYGAATSALQQFFDEQNIPY